MRFWICWLLTLAACSSETTGGETKKETNVDVESALTAILGAQCERLAACTGESFERAYPEGQGECVARGVEAGSKGNGKRESACTRSELDACVRDVQANACEAVLNGSQGLPESCGCE